MERSYGPLYTITSNSTLAARFIHYEDTSRWNVLEKPLLHIHSAP